MCRIFGFRSLIKSQVHQSLSQADNALADQSIKHPHGWGVAYYIENAPHLIKSDTSAFDCSIFKKLSGHVNSYTVIAHIRKATQGHLSILNSHPFQHAHWTFAHNGNIKDYKQYENQLKKLIDPELLPFILGETDSETIFYIFLSHLKKNKLIHNQSASITEVIKSIKDALDDIQLIIGKCSIDQNALPTETFLTFILSNGPIMVAMNGGQMLHYCTYKRKCPDRSTCPSFAPQCEAAPVDGKINHLIFSSEIIVGENIWLQMKPGEIIGVDGNMKIEKLIGPTQFNP